MTSFTTRLFARAACENLCDLIVAEVEGRQALCQPLTRTELDTILAPLTINDDTYDMHTRPTLIPA